MLLVAMDPGGVSVQETHGGGVEGGGIEGGVGGSAGGGVEGDGGWRGERGGGEGAKAAAARGA